MKGSKLLIMFGVILGIAVFMSRPTNTGFVKSDHLSFVSISDDISVYQIDIDFSDGFNKINQGLSSDFVVHYFGEYPLIQTEDHEIGFDRRASKGGRSPPDLYGESLSTNEFAGILREAPV